VPLREKLFFVQHLGIMLKAGISLSNGSENPVRADKAQIFQKSPD
jgi:hypothetical protein